MSRGPSKLNAGRKSKYTKAERDAFALRIHDGELVTDVAKEAGVVIQTMYYWCRQQRDPYMPILYQQSAGVPTEGALQDHTVLGGSGNGFNSYLGWWYPHRGYNGADREPLVKPNGKA